MVRRFTIRLRRCIVSSKMIFIDKITYFFIKKINKISDNVAVSHVIILHKNDSRPLYIGVKAKII